MIYIKKEGALLRKDHGIVILIINKETLTNLVYTSFKYNSRIIIVSRKGMFTIETSPRTKGAEQLRICLLLIFSAILPAQINRQRDFYMGKRSLLKAVQEALPLLILTAVSTVIGYYGSLLALFLMLMVYLLIKHIEGNIELYANKTLLTVFYLVYAILMMHTLLVSFGIYDVIRLDAENIKVLVKAAGVLLSIILLRINNISMRNFSWTLSKGQILGTLILASAFICITVLFDGLRFFNDFNGDIAKFSLYVLKILVLVAFLKSFYAGEY